jgi:hypothetical protein
MFVRFVYLLKGACDAFVLFHFMAIEIMKKAKRDNMAFAIPKLRQSPSVTKVTI